MELLNVVYMQPFSDIAYISVCETHAEFHSFLAIRIALISCLIIRKKTPPVNDGQMGCPDQQQGG